MSELFRRKFYPALTVLFVAAGLAAAPAVAPAEGSDDGLLSCPLGHYGQTYTPPLRTFDQQVHVSSRGSFGPCVSLTRPDLHNAEFEVEGDGTLNCLIGGSTAGTIKFRWNNDQVTRVEYPELSLTVRPGGQTVVLVTGDVVSGPFAGGTMILQSTLLTAGILQCLTTGVVSGAGPATVAFLD